MPVKREINLSKSISNFGSFSTSDQETLSANKSNSSKICLLVDDDDDDKEIFCLALEQIDPTITCHTASDGREALRILSNKSVLPDYIFLDLNMPQMDGKECLKEIKKQAPLNHIPVIIFSTSSAQKDMDETKKLGATSFITKPPLVSELAKKLTEVFTTVPAK